MSLYVSVYSQSKYVSSLELEICLQRKLLSISLFQVLKTVPSIILAYTLLFTL